MIFTIVDRKIDSRKDPPFDGAWTGQGLFYAMHQVYLKTEDGRVFDMDGVQRFLPNEAIVYPLKVVGGKG